MKINFTGEDIGRLIEASLKAKGFNEVRVDVTMDDREGWLITAEIDVTEIAPMRLEDLEF